MTNRKRVIDELVRSAASLSDDPRVKHRVDRTESALAVSLFFAYARAHKLGPAEVEGLLERPGSDGIDALAELGLSSRPISTPGREASGVNATCKTARRDFKPGRGEVAN